jgi:hypothetical protein
MPTGNAAYDAQLAKLDYGAAYAWTENELGGGLRIIDSVLTVINNGSFLIQGNPDRVALVAINFGPGQVAIAFSDQGTSGNGILLTGAGAIMSLTLRDDFTLASLPMWCQTGTSATLYVIEYSKVRY